RETNKKCYVLNITKTFYANNSLNTSVVGTRIMQYRTSQKSPPPSGVSWVCRTFSYVLVDKARLSSSSMASK
ncbi:hypothetical protein L9F63_019259, partial [Diploptera punctata]